MNLQPSPTTLQSTPLPRRVLASLTIAALTAMALPMALVRAAGAPTQPPHAPHTPAPARTLQVRKSHMSGPPFCM